MGISGLPGKEWLNRLHREFIDRHLQRVAKYIPCQHPCEQDSPKREDPGQGRSGFQGTEPDLLVKIGANASPDRQRSVREEEITERIGLARQLARKANARGEA